MALPLPTVVPDKPLGGWILGALSAQNALRKSDLENKFYPLEQAIKAQNAATYNNRFGNIGLYLRTFGAMTADQKDAYLSDPNNLSFHNQMLNEFKQGMANPIQQGNVLTPEMLSQYFGGGSSQSSNSLMQGLSGLTGINQIAGLANKMFGGNQNEAPQNNLNVANNLNSPQEAQQPIVNALKVKPTLNMQASSLNSNDPNNAYQNIIKQEYQPSVQDNIQFKDNLKSLPGDVKSRGLNAITFESWLVKNQPRYSRALQRASEYAGLLGQGKKGLESIRQKDPQAYQDFIWMEDSFIPNFANGMKKTEDLASSKTQRDELKSTVGALQDWRLNPNAAIRVFNNQIGTALDLSSSAIDTIEPIHKGVTRKVYGIPRYSGEYVKIPKKEKEEISAGAKRLAGEIVFPSFNSKEEFQAWFKRQPKITQDAVREHLGNR